MRSPKPLFETMKRKSKPIITVGDLAAMLGVSRANMYYHLRSADAPALDDLDGWETFMGCYGRTSLGTQELEGPMGAMRIGIARAKFAAIAKHRK